MRRCSLYIYTYSREICCSGCTRGRDRMHELGKKPGGGRARSAYRVWPRFGSSGGVTARSAERMKNRTREREKDGPVLNGPTLSSAYFRLACARRHSFSPLRRCCCCCCWCGGRSRATAINQMTPVATSLPAYFRSLATLATQARCSSSFATFGNCQQLAVILIKLVSDSSHMGG